MNDRTKTAAQAIRAALKSELSANSKKVSVRIDRYSMGSAIHVEIKDASMKFAEVHAIASAYEEVRRCEISGDILSGGNMYVSVGWSHGARGERAARHVDAVKEAMQGAGAHGGFYDVSSARGVSVVTDGVGGFQLFKGGAAGMHVNTAETAAAIVADYVDELAAA